MKRTLILALALSSFAGSQTQTTGFDSTASGAMDYVPDRPSSPSLASQVKVDASQLSASPTLTCSYRVTNGSNKPIYLFMVGDNPTAAYQLPSPPLHWNEPRPGAPPAGWFGTLGSARGGYSMGWQARTSKDLIQPGGKVEFSFDLPSSDAFQCDAARWRVNFATVYPVLDFPPAKLSMALANLQVAPNRAFEGDVTIQNLGPNDAILNLGTALGNGRSSADRLFLAGRGPDGRDYRLLPFGLGGVAGRVFVMVVRIPKQGAHTVHGSWWLAPQAPPGDYTLHVEFEGVPARGDSPDGEDVNRLHYWLGKVSSNEVTLAVR